MLQEFKNIRTGSTTDLKGDQNGESFVADSLARYYSMVRRGNVFVATNSAAKALSANSTTATGLIVYNPAGSGKNLVLLEAMVSLQSLPAGASSAVLTGGAQAATPTGTGTTEVANGILSAIMGSAFKSVATVYAAATIATAVIQRVLPLATAATVATSTAFPPFAKDEIAGSLIVPPGNVISVQCLTTAITCVSQLTWAEEPI